MEGNKFEKKESAFDSFQRRIEKGQDIKTTELESALKDGSLSQEEFGVLALKLLEISAHIEGGLSDVARNLAEQNTDLEERMHIDSLTGLPKNVKESLEKALRDLYGINSKRKLQNLEGVVLVALDMNSFKEINDNYGHPVGDEALRVFTERLKSVVREGQDLVFRKSGDEFFIIQRVMEPSVSVQEIRDECYALKKRINEGLSVETKNGIKIPLEASLGYAFVNKSGKEKTVEDLMAEADKSMLKDKGEKAR